MEIKQDSPSEKATVSKPVTSGVGKQPGKKSFGNKLVTWLIVALVFFLGGMALIYFTLLKDARTSNLGDQSKAADLQSELTLAQDKLAQEQAATTRVQQELDSVKGELTTALGTIDEQAAELLKSNQLRTVYKFLADVNAARAVLETLDVSSTRQAINFAKSDLVELEATGIDSDAISGFKARLEEADAKLSEPDLLSSRAALNTLYQNLLLLIDNLK